MRKFEADDLIEYAASGVFQVTGLPDRVPVALGLYTSLFLAGAICAPLALGAMRAAHRDKQQEVLDFSIQEGLAGSMDRGGPNLVSYQYTGALAKAPGARAENRVAGGPVPVCGRLYQGLDAGGLVRPFLPRNRAPGVDH